MDRIRKIGIPGAQFRTTTAFGRASAKELLDCGLNEIMHKLIRLAGEFTAKIKPAISQINFMF